MCREALNQVHTLTRVCRANLCLQSLAIVAGVTIHSVKVQRLAILARTFQAKPIAAVRLVRKMFRSLTVYCQTAKMS